MTANCQQTHLHPSVRSAYDLGYDMTVEPTEETSAEAGDGDLLAAAAHGDGAAFRYLLDRYAGRVFANCYRVLGESDEAEDATQESFARLWKVLGRKTNASAPDRDAGGWLMRTSRNLCIDRLRRRKRWTTDETVLEMQPDPTPGAEAGRQSRDVGERVRAALNNLPDRQRAAIAMVHFEGLSQTAAAETMGVSVDALESLLARGRRTLRARLEADKGDLL